MSKFEEKVKYEIANVLGLTDEWQDGTYLYHLTRVKEAFNVGTMTLDDFVEVEYELVDEIYEVVKPFLKQPVKSKFTNMSSKDIKESMEARDRAWKEDN